VAFPLDFYLYTMNRSILISFLLISFSSPAQLILEKDAQSGLFFFRNGITKKRIAGDYTYVSTDNLIYFNVLNAEQFLDAPVLEIEMAPAEVKGEPSQEKLPVRYYTQPRFLKVRKGELWGYLDAKAEEVLPAKYEQLPEPITSDLFTLRQGNEMVLISRKGEELFRADKIMFLLEDSGVIPYRQGTGWGFLDKNGKLSADAKALAKDNTQPQHLYGKFKPKDGLVVFGYRGRYGVMNMTGDIIHPSRYTDQIQIEKDFIIASIDGYLYGAMNHKGDTVADFKYKKLSKWGALAGTKPSGKMDLIFSDGSTMEVDDVVSSTGAQVVIVKNGRKGVVDVSKRKIIIEPTFDDIDFRKLMVMLKKNGTFFLLDGRDTVYKGPFDILPYYDHPVYKVMGPEGEGLYRLDQDKLVLPPQNVYVSVNKFKGRYFMIYRRSYSSPRFVLVKDDGRHLDPPFPGMLSMIEGASRPLFYCIENEKKDRSASNRIALLDENLVDTGLLSEFDYFEPINTNQRKYSNFILVKKNGKFGLLDMNMKQLLPCDYDELWYYNADSRYYRYRKGSEYGLGKFSELR
jgi:hypothetical protein